MIQVALRYIHIVVQTFRVSVSRYHPQKTTTSGRASPSFLAWSRLGKSKFEQSPKFLLRFQRERLGLLVLNHSTIEPDSETTPQMTGSLST